MKALVGVIYLSKTEKSARSVGIELVTGTVTNVGSERKKARDKGRKKERKK